MKSKGKLVIIDGIDGSGKGTLVDALAGWAKDKRLKVFDLREYGKKHHSLPEPEELKKYDVIVSAEPTFSLIGRAIRDEIIRDNGRIYSALATAQAFALDRFVIYKRVIIPALRQGKIIFQERGVTTSICYQPIQKEKLPLPKILQLEGNRLTLKYRPDLLVIVKIKPALAVKRLQSRNHKKDRAIFERLNFFQKAQSRFESGWFRKLFQNYGSRVVYVDTNGSQSESTQEIKEIWRDYYRE